MVFTVVQVICTTVPGHKGSVRLVRFEMRLAFGKMPEIIKLTIKVQINLSVLYGVRQLNSVPSHACAQGGNFKNNTRVHSGVLSWRGS